MILTFKLTIDSQKEKQIRGTVKSEVLRLIGPKSLVILDGSNYIKGKYQLIFLLTECIILI